MWKWLINKLRGTKRSPQIADDCPELEATGAVGSEEMLDRLNVRRITDLEIRGFDDEVPDPETEEQLCDQGSDQVDKIAEVPEAVTAFVREMAAKSRATSRPSETCDVPLVRARLCLRSDAESVARYRAGQNRPVAFG